MQDESRARFEKRRERLRKREKGGKRKGVKDKDWILKKKEVGSSYVFAVAYTLTVEFCQQLYRKRGKDSVPNDSKYTGRKRKPVF